MLARTAVVICISVGAGCGPSGSTGDNGPTFSGGEVARDGDAPEDAPNPGTDGVVAVDQAVTDGSDFSAVAVDQGATDGSDLSAVAGDQGATGGSDMSSACPSGGKMCNSICVPELDPNHGCGGPD